MSCPSRVSSFAVSAQLLLTALCALLLAQPAKAQASQQRRFQLDVEMSRQGEVSNGAELGQQRLVQAWRVSALVASDGVRHLANPLDPLDAQRLAAAAQQRSGTQRPAVPAAPPSAQQLQALQAQAQALMARCGQDAACLAREARAISAAQVARGDRALEQRLLAQQPAAASGAVDDGGPAEPYLHFHGTGACQLDVAVQVDARTDGQFGDVQGIVPYTETARADEHHRGDLLCPSIQAVLDTRNGRVWTYLMQLPQEARGSTTREDRGRRRAQADARVSLNWMEARGALEKRLLQLDLRGGQDVQRIAVPGGQLELRMRWSFAPL